MQTCQAIVDRALSKLGIKSAYAALNSTDSAAGLRGLIGVYHHLITSGAFGELNDVIPAQDLTADEYARYMTDGTVTVTLPTTIAAIIAESDYGDLGLFVNYDYQRPPRDGAIVTIVNTTAGTTQDYIYDGQIRRWIEVNALALTDVAPLSHRDDNGLAALVAVHLSDEFGIPITPTIAAHARDFQLGITQNWSQAGEEIHRGTYY